MIVNRTPVLVPRGDHSSGATASQLGMLLDYELFWAKDNDSNGGLYISENGTLKKVGITYGIFTTLSNGLVPASTTADKRYLGADGAWHGVFSTGNMGLVPAPSSGDSGKYLRSDGTWQTVSGGGTTYSTLSPQAHSATTQYVINGSGNNTSYFLRGDGTWQKVPWSMITNTPPILGIGINTHTTADGKNYGNINTSHHEVKDYEGNIYHEIQIGNQIWLMEDLKSTHFMTDCIGMMNDCYGYMNPEHTNDYPEYPSFSEGLYYGVDVVYGGHDKDIIPGYHIPTEDEWQTLIDFLNCKYNGRVNQALASNPADCGFDECWNDDSVPEGSPGQRSDLNNASGFYARPRGWFDCDDTNEVHDNGNRAVYWCSDVEAVSIDYDKIVPDQMAVSTIGAANPMFRIRLIKNQKADKDELATVAFTGDYNDLENKPEFNQFNYSKVFYGEMENDSDGFGIIYVWVDNWGGTTTYFTQSAINGLIGKQIQILLYKPDIIRRNKAVIYIRFMTSSSSWIQMTFNDDNAVGTFTFFNNSYHKPVLNVYLQNITNAWPITSVSNYTTRCVDWPDFNGGSASSGDLYIRLHNGNNVGVVEATGNITFRVGWYDADIHSSYVIVHNISNSDITISVNKYSYPNPFVGLITYLLSEKSSETIFSGQYLILTFKKIDSDYFTLDWRKTNSIS